MTDATQTAAYGLIGVVLAAVISLMSVRMGRKGDRETAFIDRLEKRLEAVEQDLAESIRRERLMGDYLEELRRHIAAGSPPPPPPWPEGLLK